MNANPPTRLRLAIVGAGGRLGGVLTRAFADEHEVIPLTRRQLDLADPASIRAALEPLDYDRLLITAALTAVDRCEDHEDEAFAINGDAPGLIAELSAAKGAQVTYFSTDFVFGGISSKPCSEQRVPRPLSVYGASKLDGEEQVLAASDRHLVVRIAWLFGGGKPAFPEWILAQAQEKEQLALPAEKTGSPTCADDLPEYLAPLLGLDGGEPASGVFHLANSGSCSWRDWGQFCLDAALRAGVPLRTRTIDANCLEDVAAFTARRPVHSVLDTRKFRDYTGIVPRSWQEALLEHLQRGGALSPASPSFA